MAKRRAESMTPERRKEIASNAGKARRDALTPERRMEISRKATAARLKKLKNKS